MCGREKTTRVSIQGGRSRPSGCASDDDEADEADEPDDSDSVKQRYVDENRDSLAETKERDVSTGKILKSGTLLFIGNLPFKVSVLWLLKTFQRFGRVSDAFIPHKLTRGFGRRYGFVRFESEKEAEQAIRVLNGSPIGYWNLIVQKSKPKLGCVWSKSREGSGISSNVSVFSRDSRVLPSQRMLLSNGKGCSGTRKREDFSQEAFNQDMIVSGSRKRVLGVVQISDWEKCAAIACLRNGKIFHEMRSIIMDTCAFVRSISLIKDNSVLIVFQSSSHCDLAIENELWAHWFYSVKAWSDGKSEGKNRIWVECFGVPFCAWNENTFEAIASVWGSIVDVHPETSDMVQLSVLELIVGVPHCISRMLYF